MWRYLVRRIEDHPTITVRTRTELVALDGDRHLERVQWRDSQTGIVETHDVRHVFRMTGAVPNTGWLNGCVALDGRGFKTGPDVSPEELTAAGWPLRGRRTCWKPIVPESSRSATSGVATSSGWRPPSAKDRLPWPSCTKCFISRTATRRRYDETNH
jgi:hypothetical protein